MKFPEKVQIIEVIPRDGLQSYPEVISTEKKIELINRLSQTGLRRIEATAFVRPDVIPQLADAAEVMAKIERVPGVVYRALVPNRRGAERAVEAGVDEMLGLITCSETYNQKNQNMSIARNLEVMEEVLAVGRDAGIPVTIAIALTFFCPYEGITPPEKPLSIIEHLYNAGARSIYAATSSGMADPRQVYSLLSEIRRRWPDMEVALHLHNTNGMALANALAALQAGVTTFEGALCGIGGGIVMPKGMSAGNVATEDLVQMFENMGIDTGVDFNALLEVGEWAQKELGIPCYGYASRGGTREATLEMGRQHL